MPQEIAIVICNYNKRELLCKCIASVFNSIFTEFDLIVVDNASTDDSARYIREHYTQKLELIENKKNLGGSGGFNTGIRRACEVGYKYIVLLDNDAFLKPDALEKLVTYMNANDSIGLLGAKILSADEPDIIQDYGSYIDFENYNVLVPYKNYSNNGVPEIKDCDYIPACAAIVRRSAIDRVGLLPERNFLYWDDIEWGYRFKLAGYGVCALGDAIAWHKQGAVEKVTTLPTYYFWRNRITFFAAFLPKAEITKFCNHLLREFYYASSACIMNSRFNTVHTLNNALCDALYRIYGKAESTLPADKPSDKLAAALESLRDVQIIYNGNLKLLQSLVAKMNKLSRPIKLTICGEDIYHSALAKQFPYAELTREASESVPILKLVKHIFNEKHYEPDMVYIDEYLNIVADAEDRRFCENFESAWDYFYHTNFNFVYDRLCRINEESEL